MKLWKNENMPADQNGVSVQNLKRQMFRQIVTMTVCLAIVSVAAFSFGSRSWYAMNREVSQKDNSVTSSSASPSLFIRAYGQDMPLLYLPMRAQQSFSRFLPLI